jgi:hypothetical protein
MGDAVPQHNEGTNLAAISAALVAASATLLPVLLKKLGISHSMILVWKDLRPGSDIVAALGWVMLYRAR